MKGYTKEAIKKICEEENIKYIRMQFSDMEGMLKNVEIPVHLLKALLEQKRLICFLYQTLILS